MVVKQFVCFTEEKALLCGEDVWLCMWGCICVVLIIIIIIIIIIITKIIIIIIILKKFMVLMEVRGVEPNFCSGHDLGRKLPPFPTHTVFFLDVSGYLALPQSVCNR